MVTITSASQVTEWLWVCIGLFLTFKEALSFLMGTNLTLDVFQHYLLLTVTEDSQFFFRKLLIWCIIYAIHLRKIKMYQIALVSSH